MSGLAATVAAGAFGAHALAGRWSEGGEALWRTGMHYAGLAFVGVGLLAAGSGRWLGVRAAGIAGSMLVAGACVFAGTLGAMALGGPRWLGAVTPLGGAAMVAGFLLAGWAATRRGQ